MRVRLLQFGDLHMDAPFTSLSDMEGRPFQRRMDLKRALSRIIDLADSKDVDIILVCGDLYEHGYSDKSSINHICSQFERIPGIPVLVIPGNHDPCVPGSFYVEHRWPSNVHILGSDDIFELNGSGVRIYGGLHAPVTIEPSFINILMYHGTLDMSFDKDAFQPISSREVECMGFDYCALGHFHSVLHGAGTRGIFYNAGSPEPLGFDEGGDHGVYIAEIEKESGRAGNVVADFVKICSKRAISLNVDVTDCNNDQQAAMLAASAMEEAGSSDDLFRVLLHGRIPSDIRIDIRAVADHLSGKAFYLKITDKTVPDYDLAQISREHGLRGIFTKKMLERASEAGDDGKAETVMQALYYGLEAIDEGKVCI